MSMIKKVMIGVGLAFVASTTLANNGMYEVDVTGLQGLSILEGTTVWQPVPLYPKLALRRAVEGKVLVQYDINTEGQAENIHVIEASPEGFFNNATVRALENATFGIAYQDGKAVAINGVKKRFVYRIEKDVNGSGARPVVSID